MLVVNSSAMVLLVLLQRLDTHLFHRLFRQGERVAVTRSAAKIISRSGDGHLHVLLPLLLATMQLPQLNDYLMLFLVTMAIERVIYFCLKNTLRRRRPQDFVPGFRSIITASDKFSFPSGHSSAAFCLATVTSIVLGGSFIALYVWATGVALSRVLLGVHFPGDTLAGAIMGSGIAVLAAQHLALF